MYLNYKGNIVALSNSDSKNLSQSYSYFLHFLNYTFLYFGH